MKKHVNIALLALFAAGVLAALGKVFVWGESVTNYGAYTPWGLWVGLYALLVGAAAGAVWIGLYSSVRQGGRCGELTTVAMVAAGVSLAIGLAFIGTDLGKPVKGFNIFLSPSFSSPLAWASWLYLVFFACLAGYLFTNAKKAFMYLGALAAAGFLLAESLFFGGMVARSLWHTYLTPLAFITSGLAGGSALVWLVGLTASPQAVSEEGFILKKAVLASLAAHVAVEAVHLVTGLGGAEKAFAIKSMWASWPFWGLFLIAGVALPAGLLLKKDCRLAVAPPLLVLLGLAAYKYSFVRFGFAVEPLPGLATAFHDARLSLAYVPSAVEWLVAVGFLAGIVWTANLVITKISARQA
ncbi:NrfD/PsrC family molybdoenzyme membrane anchor subunit [Sporolituus thermophilus]|uniref:Ni/Fe-hydrogenase 2 integral membrane subunit HybB n=1 Tax=Sporolituus thermophilus DSM 23256 TaxID=1123285 RepID=A0A1G7HR16_9FIRM|nr:NrfD/PsrC family molybdoenzyme membrane anchor subunit [Sporolituus thermophilus]SDF02870.1 Ni/Fe-hydrogenase 2 integral membrane subunit HybB [Sporolituus thermophilus DSM 23256]